MGFRKEVIDLFDSWHRDNPTATILFEGRYGDLPEDIYVYNYLTYPRLIDLQKRYVALLQSLYGESFVYGEELLYAVEIDRHPPYADIEITKQWKGTV